MRTITSVLVSVAAAGVLAAQPDPAAAKRVPVEPAPDASGATIATDPVDPVVAPTSSYAPVPTPEIILVEPPPPPPPPRPRKPVPRNSVLLAGTALTARMPEGAGRLADLGRGAALHLAWLPRRCDCPVGVDARATFLGSEDSRLYALDVQVVATPQLGRRLVVPFMSVGLGFGTVRFAEIKQTSTGLALGPAGSVGLHGFLTDDLYWRAEVGAIGTGGAVVVGGASLGWVLGS
jgi:hypothetical protein